MIEFLPLSGNLNKTESMPFLSIVRLIKFYNLLKIIYFSVLDLNYASFN